MFKKKRQAQEQQKAKELRPEIPEAPRTDKINLEPNKVVDTSSTESEGINLNSRYAINTEWQVDNISILLEISEKLDILNAKLTPRLDEMIELLKKAI